MGMMAGQMRLAPVGGDIYPDIAASQATTPGSGTSHSIVVNASTGQRSLVFLSVADAYDPVFPAGWTVIVDQYPTGCRMRVAYRDFQAGDPSSITITTSSSTGICAQAVKFSAGTFDPAIAPIKNSFFFNGTASIDPFALTDPSGIRPKMALAWCGSDGIADLVSMPPNMTSLLSNKRGLPYSSSHIARQTISAASFDPDPFTISAAQNNGVATIYIVGFPA